MPGVACWVKRVGNFDNRQCSYNIFGDALLVSYDGWIYGQWPTRVNSTGQNRKDFFYAENQIPNWEWTHLFYQMGDNKNTASMLFIFAQSMDFALAND